MEAIFTDLAYMVACWGCGIFTGLGLGCAMGVDRYARRQRQLEDA